MTLDVSVTDMFCGAGGSTTGAVHAGAQVTLALNHWPIAIETHNTNYPNTTHILTDISRADPWRYPRTTILIASPECFPAGTLILTKHGLLPIETIQVGEEVLTHRNRWRAVTAVMSRDAETVVVKGRGHCGLEVTTEHPIWVRHCSYPWNNALRLNERHLDSPEWRVAGQLSRDYFWAMPKTFGEEILPIPQVEGRGAPFTEEFWWIIGRWLGDGSLRLRVNNPRERAPRRPYRLMPAMCEVCGQPALPHNRYPHLAQFYCSKTCKHKAEAVSSSSGGSSVQICCAHQEADMLEARLNFAPPKGARAGQGEYRWSRRRLRTAILFDCPHNGLALWLLEQFGQHADGKHLPAWVLTMPEEWRRALLDGYVSADGNRYRDGIAISTVSRALAIGVMLLTASLGYHPVVGVNRRTRYTIEGRSGAMQTLYLVRWATHPEHVYAEATENHVWGRIRSITPGRLQAEVFNLSVEEDESYIADGIIVHNCTNHTLAKGRKRRGLGQAPLPGFGERGYDPAEERSRCTMWDPLRWTECHRYELVILENVVDARLWVMWDAWLHAWQALGYDWEIVYLNSMFAHPTPQSRDRLYFVAWKRGNRKPDLCIEPLAFCQKCGRDVQSRQSWKNPTRRYGKYRQQYVYRCPSCASVVTPYYYAAANAIDWSLPTPRIGDRKKPLRAKTMQRIAYGLSKFAQQPFTVQLNKTSDRVRAAFSDPFPTQTADNGLVMPPPFLLDQTGDYRPRDLSAPLSTVVGAGNHHSLIVPPAWLLTYYNHGQMAEVTEAAPTVTTLERHALITAGEQCAASPIRVEDCGFRMLSWEEIRAAMAFPSDYILLGSRKDIIRQLGNAVTPPVMELLMRRCLASLC